MKTRKGVATFLILGALLLSTVTPVLGAQSLQDDGLSASIAVEETLGSLEASASADPRLAEPGEEITFTGSATGGTGSYVFAWNFGDGNTGTGATVTHAYSGTGIYDVTLTVTDSSGSTAQDTVTVAVGEPSEHIISNLIAAFFIVPPEYIDALRQEGWGYGEIAMAYFVAQLSGEDIEEIIALREGGSGWGEIRREILGFAGLHGYNLGMIVSGREAPAHLQNLAYSCGMEVQGLTELLQESGGKFGTVRLACRLAQQAEDEGLTAEIIEMRQEGMKWREIKEALGLVPERGPQGQGLGQGQEGQGTQGQGLGKEQEGQDSQGQGHGKGQGSQGQGHDKGQGKGPKH